MKKKVFIVLVLLTVIFSCQKEKNDTITTNTANTNTTTPTTSSVDTIYPLSYFPVYPGSWWKYVGFKEVQINGDSVMTVSDTVTSYSGSLYTKIISGIDTIYFPSYDNWLISGYERREGTGSWYTFFSDTLPVGSTFSIVPPSHMGLMASGLKVVTKDTSIILFGKTYYPITVIGLYLGDVTNLFMPYEKRYYAKDIGLIKIDRYDFNGPIDSLSIYSKKLIDYYINK